jgi:5-(aminomethyl)-3-furanmethanol phosphate kinase
MRCLWQEGSRCFWDRAMWVVKLGGSLHDDAPALRRWLRSLVEAPDPPRVLVPGGGPFADAVRRLQPAMGFGDLAAHRMAILAMQQFGLALQALEPRPARSSASVSASARPASVWLPWRLAGRDATIAASWDVTSDSLACWLAARLGAAALLLVKSGPVPTGEATAEALAATGLVDAAFPALARRFAGSIRVLPRDREFPGPLGAKPGGCRVAR